MRHHLPVLSQREPRRDELERVVIATPCTASWEAMESHGSAGVRFCGKCEQNVYDTSALTRSEVLVLLGRKNLPCLRLYRRPDGRLTTSDCWSRLRRARAQGVGPFVRTALLITWAFLAAGAASFGGRARAWANPSSAASGTLSASSSASASPSADKKEPEKTPKPPQPKKDPPPQPPTQPPMMGAPMLRQ